MNLGIDRKIAFITGSDRGIGFATARALLEEGATVIINGRNECTLKTAMDELKNGFSERVYAIQGDILNEDTAISIIKFIKTRFGKLDIFVANLGNGKPQNSNQLDLDEWRRFFDVNLFGNLGVLSAIYPLLKKGVNPAVSFISTIAAIESIQAPVGYAASKSSVIILSKYLSRLWAYDGIRVNCIIPGNVYFEGGRWDELRKADSIGIEEYINNNVPMKRFGKPEEIADAIAFMVSERASFITGTTIVIDGGQTNIV